MMAGGTEVSGREAGMDNVRRLRSLIHDGDYRVGERLGSERELARRLGVTRSTLRASLSIMEHNHEIRRLIGRHGGVYVADGRLERNINTVESLPSIVRRQGGTLSSTVVSAVIEPASPSDVRMLELPDGAAVYSVVRLRKVDGRPLSLEASHLPASMFPMFLSRDLTEAFYALFEHEYGVRPGTVEEILEPVLSDDRESELLDVQVGTPLIKVRRIARTEGGIPFERATDAYIASRMRFTMHHSGYVRLSATVAGP